MCDPITALTVASTALTATGQITSGIAAKRQASYQAAVAEQNASLVKNQQEDAIARQLQQRVQLDRKYSQLQGQQQAAFGANGIDASFGSAKAVAGDTAMLRNEDAASLYDNQKREIEGLDVSSANLKSQAQASRMQGSAAMTGAIFGAGSTILTGANQYARLKVKTGASGTGAGAYGISGSDGFY